MLKKITNPFFLLSASIFLQSFSLLSIKYSTLQVGYTSLLLLIVAFGFIGLRSVIWQYLLRASELSRIYPFVSLVQVLILLYAAILFQEPITINNVIGLTMMLSGVFFMSR